VKGVDNSKKAIKTEVVTITKSDSSMVSAFLSLGRDYLKDLPIEKRERFLQSILARQEEPDRWLLLLKHQGENVGFAHVKIDKNERVGWGFILEFYIVPIKRKMGLGRTFFNLVAGMLQARGVKDVWLLADSSAELFWCSLGFKLTSAMDKETGQHIMTKRLKPSESSF
jgi:GNAT superfamily N-acetyltransferase